MTRAGQRLLRCSSVTLADLPADALGVHGLRAGGRVLRNPSTSQLYTAALDWIRTHPRFRRVIVAMRASNAASRRACERQGFEAVETALRTWPDATSEDEVIYELRL